MKKSCFLFLLSAICFLFFLPSGQAQQTPAAPQWKLLPPPANVAATGKKVILRTTAVCSPDSIVLTRQSQIDSFPLTHPGCTALRKLRIDGKDALSPITNVDSLKYLTEISNDLNISRTSLTNLSGLNGLTKIGGWLWFDHDSAVTSLGLTHLTQLSLLILESLPKLASMAGISASLQNTGMGTIIISGTALEDLSGLEGIESVPNMYLSVNQKLKSLQGLHNLRYSDYGLSIYGNAVLTDITALSGLTRIDNGTLEVQYNHQLTSLEGLGNITTIGRGLWIVGNSQLANLSDLNDELIIRNQEDDGGQKDNLKIEWNNQLSFCSSTPICNYLASGGEAIIQGNATGCETAEEILASCTTCADVTLKTWTGSEDRSWNKPGNWLPAGIPAKCDSVVVPSGKTQYPWLDNNVTIRSLTMEEGTEIDMRQFSLIINGDTKIDNAQVFDGQDFIVRGGQNIQLLESGFYVKNMRIEGYNGSLMLQENYFDKDLTIVDKSTRTGTNYLNENYVYGNFSITANATDEGATTELSPQFADYAYGNATITVNAPVNFNIGGDDNFMVSGNLVVKSNYPGYPHFNNIGFDRDEVGLDLHVTQAGTAPIRFNNLYVNKYRGGSVILDQDVTVSGDLFLRSGLIKTEPGKLLILESSASVIEFNSSSYVWGPVKKYGSQPFTFPIGDADTWGHCSISNISASANGYTAQYFRRNPALDGMDTSKHDSSVRKISGKEYWKITEEINVVGRTPGTNAGLTITLTSADNRSEPLRTINDLRVARWNGSLWKDEGNGGTAGSESLADVSSAKPLSDFGVFTLGYTPTRVPVITVGNVAPLACLNQNLKIPFSLDTLMLGNNVFTAQLSDSTGSFANPFFLGSKTTNQADTILAFFPGHIPAMADYKIRIIGSAPRDTSVNTQPVNVRALPKNFAVKGPLSVCAGMAYKYFATQKEPGVTYTWKVTSGQATVSASGDTALITPTAAGSVNLDLSATNACGTITSSLIGVQVLPPPPSSTPGLNNIGRWLYAGVPLPPQASGYRWFRNDTVISGANSSSYYASSAGSFTVRYFNTCGNGPASSAVSFAAASVPQTISFAVPADKSVGEAPFIINASASSGLPVQLTLVSGPGTLSGNSYTITGTGLVTIRAVQLGDHVYDTAAPVVRSFMVKKGIQTISFPAIPDQTLADPAYTLNASSSAGLPVSYAVLSGPATLSGSQLFISNVGSVTVRATQAGNADYEAAPPADRTFCVSATTLSSLSGPLFVCPGQTAIYSVSNIAGLTYNWRLSNGTTFPASTSSVSIVWNTPGTYTLLVSGKGPCGAVTGNASLTVNVINPVTPGAVSNMLPGDGAKGQGLPLQLSWIPGSNALTYDVYIWDAASAKPSMPFAADLTTVSYTLPANAFTYNKTYKWQVVAKNACLQTAGPVQEFSLRPLPDLVVSGVQVPASAFSGQKVSFSWRVTNMGPGNTTTNQRWTDAVFLSFDTTPVFNLPPNTNAGAWSSLDIPQRPLLVATRPNVTALDMGQQYTNTVDFTLPLNYSQPLYVYVITNYPAGSQAPLQMSTANDTARAPAAIAVTLSPTPDLRVDTVLTPSSVFSGSTVNVTYKVKNYGVLTPVGSTWSDRLYISQTPVFNSNTAVPLTFKKASGNYYPDAPEAIAGNDVQLQAESSYTRNVEVVIPNFIFGTYFIHVVTNHSGSLYEAALASNNTNNSQLQVFLTPTPQLTVNALTVPVTSASTTQPIGLNWNIFNKGFTDNIEKLKGHYYVRSTGSQLNCSSGTTAYRDSLGAGSSYWVDKVYLSTSAAGLNTATAIFLGEVPHGTLNSGRFSADGTKPDVCLAAGTATSGINENTGNVIQPGSNHPSTFDFVVPPDLPQGSYYVYVLANANKTVYEYPGTQQVAKSALPVTILRPDVTVSSVTVPTTSVGGQPVTISYAVKNNGPGSIFTTVRKDRIYVSSSAVFDGSAQLLSTQDHLGTLPAGLSVSHSYTHTFPAGTSGIKYFYVQTNYDSSFRETTYANNTSAAASSTFSTAVANDLVMLNIAVADTVYAVFNTAIRYAVANNGGGTASGTWKDSLFISCNPVYNNATAYFLAERTQSRTLPTNANYTDSFNLNIPLTFDINNCFPSTGSNTAYFFIKTNADNRVFEGANTGNNLAGSGSRIIVNPLVDHVVTTVSGQGTASVARPYAIGWTVKNSGQNPGVSSYSLWNDAIYFSADSVFNSKAVEAERFFENQTLNTGQVYNRSKTVIVPNLLAGNYYVFAVSNAFNQIRAERVLTNNANLVRNADGSAKKISVVKPQLPDLADTLLTAAPTVAVGQPLTIIHRVKNGGAGATYPEKWSNEVWLSTDFVAGNAGDIKIAAKNYRLLLQPGGELTDTIMAQIDMATVPGNYILIMAADAGGNIIETADSNNFAFSYLTVYRPNPSDLLVQSISKPDTVLLGYTMDGVKWVIRNHSPNNADGSSTDGLYLTKKNVLDSTAILLGVVNKQLSIPALGRDTVTHQPLVNGVPEGAYNLLVRTDLLNNIVETDKTNNTGIAAGTVYVKVKELLLEATENNTLHTISRQYKLVIPDSLKGATILVSLRTADSLTVRNEMFVGYGYVPTPANFDYRFQTANYGNQQIVMTSVIGGVYYLTVRTVSPNPPVQNITLKATRLPFAILTVSSSSGGNIGNVTVKLNGSLFAEGMTAKLTRGSTTIPASAIYFTNSTQVFATFNLKGAPLGVYTVTLTKPDTKTATLPNGFTVVPANNGGIITGGGNNTGGSGNGNEPGCDPGTPSGLNSQLVTEVVIPKHAFSGWTFIIQVNYNNPTNFDVPAQVRILYNDHNVPVALTQAGLAEGKTSLYLELTEPGGPPGIIRAGGSGTITIYAKAPLSIPGHTIVNFSLK